MCLDVLRILHVHPSGFFPPALGMLGLDSNCMKDYEENNTLSAADTKEERALCSFREWDQMVETVKERGKGSWMAGDGAVLPQTVTLLQFCSTHTGVLSCPHSLAQAQSCVFPSWVTGSEHALGDQPWLEMFHNNKAYISSLAKLSPDCYSSAEIFLWYEVSHHTYLFATVGFHFWNGA